MQTIEEERFLDTAFDVFENDPIDITSEDKFSKDFYPTEALGDNDSNIRFTINSQGNYWLKWDEFLLQYDACIVKQEPGTSTWVPLAATDVVFPCNNAGHSFFKDVKVNCNFVAIDGGTAHYHLLSYLNNTVQYNLTSKSTHMEAQGYYIPTKTTDYTYTAATADASKAKFEMHTRDWDDASNDTNNTLIKEFAGSKLKSFQIPLKVDLFHQGKHLPPGFRLDIELFRNDPRFSLVVKNRTKPDTKYRVEFKDMKLSVDYVRPAQEVGRQLESSRQHGKNILYQFNQLKVFRHTIPKV